MAWPICQVPKPMRGKRAVIVGVSVGGLFAGDTLIWNG